MNSYHRWIGITLACYWIALFIGTHIPLHFPEGLPEDSDKWMHFAGYAGLAYLLGLWMATTRPLTTGRTLRLWAVIATYAVIDELLQAIPRLNRTADVKDAAADWLGAAAGLGLVHLTLALGSRLRSAPKPLAEE